VRKIEKGCREKRTEGAEGQGSEAPGLGGRQILRSMGQGPPQMRTKEEEGGKRDRQQTEERV